MLHPLAPPSPWSLVFLGFGACFGIVSSLANSSTFSLTGLLISLAGCLLLRGGWPTLRRFLFPLSLRLFTFPVPDVLYGEITQTVAVAGCRTPLRIRFLSYLVSASCAKAIFFNSSI